MSTCTDLDLSPFFQLKGFVGSQPVTAELADGRLRIHPGLSGIASALDCDIVALTSHRGAPIPTTSGAAHAAATTLLATFDRVTYAQIGVTVTPAGWATDVANDPTGPGTWATVGCPRCASTERRSEFHAENWCPFGYGDPHTHLWCVTCGHQWIAQHGA